MNRLEAATAILPTRTSESLSSPSLTRLGRPATAGRLSTLLALLSAPRDFLRAFFGPVEYEVGWFCHNCVDVHADGEDCPRSLIGDCDICLTTVTLDHYGNCRVGRYHNVTNRRSKF